MHKNMTTIKSKLLVFFILIAITINMAFSQTSNNYRIQQAVIDEGGSTSHSSQHNASDAVGQPSPVGKAISVNYIVSSGFFGDCKMMTLADESEISENPVSFGLSQNYPNPFNPSTTIEFAIPKSAFVTLKIYNLMGEEVATLVAEQRAAGIHQLNWDAKELASGVYLYRLEAGKFIAVKKLILLR